jgi:hypothetical protein
VVDGGLQRREVSSGTDEFHDCFRKIALTTF